MPTNDKTIRVAQIEARRFLDRSDVAMTFLAGQKDTRFYPSKEIAALKRSSMDLTRALADLRRAV